MSKEDPNIASTSHNRRAADPAPAQKLTGHGSKELSLDSAIKALQGLLLGKAIGEWHASSSACHEAVQAAEPNRKHEVFNVRLIQWGERLMKMQGECIDRLVLLAIASREIIAGHPIGWVEEQLQQAWAPIEMLYDKWGMYACDWPDRSEGWTAPIWLTEWLVLHPHMRPFAKGRGEQRLSKNETEYFLRMVGAFLDCHVGYKRIIDLKYGAVKIASQLGPDLSGNLAPASKSPIPLEDRNRRLGS